MDFKIKILSEYLESEWNKAINYFWDLEQFERCEIRTRYYILTLSNLGYNKYEIFNIVTSGIIVTSHYNAREILKELDIE